MTTKEEKRRLRMQIEASEKRIYGEEAYRKRQRELFVLRSILILAVIGLCATCAFKIRDDMRPRSCEWVDATVVAIETDRHCTMGCRGYDHAVTLRGRYGDQKFYERTNDNPYREAIIGDRVRYESCTVEGREGREMRGVFKRIPPS